MLWSNFNFSPLLRKIFPRKTSSINNQTLAVKGTDKKKKKTFSQLTPNLPLVLCDRIHLYHLLQVHLISCARAHWQSDGRFPRGRSRVQQSTSSGGVRIPLAIISFPLPYCTQNIGSTLNHVQYVTQSFANQDVFKKKYQIIADCSVHPAMLWNNSGGGGQT